MHGQVSVQSVPGAGCLFAIRVPLSLTSSHGLLLGIGSATYMLPLESIQRIVSVSPRDIQIVEGHAALTLDGHPITLIHLADLLNETRHATGKHSNGQHSNTSGLSLALLLGSGDRQVACMVDAVIGEQELVVHRLPAPLQRVRYIAGATILADGRVVPILDLVDVLRAAIGTRGMLAITAEPETMQRTPTVVVADDSITTRTLEKNILEAAGYRVHLATDGAEAIHVLHTLVDNGGCDLLLSDIDMPNLNGFDLTSQVRADPVLKHVPIVLVTSLDTASDRERGMAAGADAYIVKRAFDQQSLLDTIAQLI
jgi:two-component system chemotaxis sensor kinase CheA